MDLTALPLRAAAARPHVLLVTTPGGTATRLAAERQLRLQDLPQARTPAEADVLLVAGPECRGLRPAIDRLWQSLPAPRARARAATPAALPDALARCRAELAAPPARRHAGRRHEDRAGGGPDAGSDAGPAVGFGNGRDEHDGHDENSGGGHGSHGDHGSRGDHGSHGSHGSHGDSEPPWGLPMAGQGADRDGLTLDQLHVPLGPFLADWPDGLTARLTLQGDVVQCLECAWPPVGGRPAAAGPPFWGEPWARAAAGARVAAGEGARRRAAAHADSLGRLLAVAGWAGAATTARRLRDDLLDGTSSAELRPGVQRFARRVGRSRTLYWLTRGTGVLTAEAARDAGVTGPAARADGDVPARYRTWLAALVRDVDRLADRSPLDPAEEGPRGGGAPDGPWPSAALVRVLPGLLEGAELAAARLVVASLDPDPDELAAVSREVGAGD
ncbi:hypothetical protein ABZ686_09970 [Streptomyces sp. NPDC006992]|uniref:hypothetical protein n=1 Tax=Streptomyces sp. NPDC006992 TaxID=3155601 RepID=UPI0033CD0D76